MVAVGLNMAASSGEIEEATGEVEQWRLEPTKGQRGGGGGDCGGVWWDAGRLADGGH